MDGSRQLWEQDWPSIQELQSVGSIVDVVQVFGNKEKHMTELYEETECTRKEGFSSIILINILLGPNVVVLDNL